MDEKYLLIVWLSDRIIDEIQEENIAKEALKAAEKNRLPEQGQTGEIVTEKH